MTCRAKWLRAVALAASAVGGLAVLASAASAANCTKETRNLALGDGAASLRSYLCRGDRGPMLRVEFHRMDEISTIGLFKGEPIGPLRQILGGAPIEKNRLYRQLDDVFSRFGRRPEYDMDRTYSLAVPGGGKGAGGSLQDTVWQLGTVSFIPLTKDVASISNALTFPSGLSFFYVDAWDKCRQWPLTCTIVWRPMTEADVTGYDEDMRRYYESIDIPYDPEDTLTDNYLRMLVYLAKGQWPKHLEFVHGRFDECGDSFVFSYLGRDLLFDVAVIENLSDRELSLDALWGVVSRSDALRQTGEDSGAPEAVPLETRTLPPGAKRVVPLRFRLVAKKSDIDWNDIVEARKVHAQIRRGKRNQVVAASEWNSGFKKKRGAFGPPASPIVKNFVYGQALDLNGLVVGGERVLLEGSSANYLEVTTIFEGASCPYLYSWNSESKKWERYGQVIVRANDVSKKRSETIVFAGLKNRFQLREEELEITYLDRVALTLRLEDGRTVTRQSGTGKLARDDDDFLLLHPGQVAELVFETNGIEAGSVKESALTVTGFYRPFSSFMGQGRISSPVGDVVPVNQDGDWPQP